jgi:hypothetical protein
MIGRGDDCNHLTMKIRWMFCWAEKILCSFEFQAGMLLVSEKKAQGKIRMARDRTENVSSRAEAPTCTLRAGRRWKTSKAKGPESSSNPVI